MDMDELLDLSLRDIIAQAEAKGTALIHVLDKEGNQHSLLLVHGEAHAETLETLATHFFGRRGQKN